MSNDAHASSEETPDHMIVWLDLDIGRPENYKELKAAFSSTADPNHALPVPLLSKDDEEINRTVGFQEVRFEGVKFLLAAFSNVERCIDFLTSEENKRRKIFMITSGQMGRAALPLIKEKCINVFTDPNTGQLCACIYVFCHGIERNMDWMGDYVDYIASVFQFDQDVLVRLISDIANYFRTEGRRLLQMEPPNYPAAYSRLSWAHTLYDRYRTMEGNLLSKEFREVNELLEQVENVMRGANDDD